MMYDWWPSSMWPDLRLDQYEYCWKCNQFHPPWEACPTQVIYTTFVGPFIQWLSFEEQCRRQIAQMYQLPESD